MKPLFKLGRVVASCGIIESIKESDMHAALQRHSSGDWGDVCTEDLQANQDALQHGLRLLSVYCSSEGIRFWIITEADRSATTILLPDEY